MPRGFAEIYAKQTNSEMFSAIEEILNTKGFRLENPRTNRAQVWNAEGDMLELSREGLFPHILAGNLITFWKDSGESISVIFDEDVYGMSKSILLLDGFDEKESESLFEAIKLFILSKHNIGIEGFVFDRREYSENIDWGKHLKAGKFEMNSIGDELKIASQKIILTSSPIDLNINNVYVAVRIPDDTFELYEFDRNIKIGGSKDM